MKNFLYPIKMRIAIIGTAGRDNTIEKLSKEKYQWMINQVKKKIKTIKSHCDDEKIILVSGGAAFSDHIAIKLYQKHPDKYDLVLYFPCKFDPEKCQFEGNGPGKSANFYHKRFSDLCGYDSLIEIGNIIKKENVTIIIGNGFHDRNMMIAQNCDFMIALTFSQSDSPEEGGTKDTWNKMVNGNKIHIRII